MMVQDEKAQSFNISRLLRQSMKCQEATIMACVIGALDSFRSQLKNGLEHEGFMEVFEKYYEPVFEKIYVSFMNDFLELFKDQVERGEELLAEILKNVRLRK